MLSKILSKWLDKSSNNDDVAKISNLPKYAQAKLAVEKQIARKGKTFNPMKAATVSLQCINPNIIALIDRINGYAKILEEGSSLTPTDCFSEVATVTLDGFFTDTDNTYIPLNTLDEFLTTSKRLLIVIGRGMERNDSNVQYSLRLMTKCISSIQNVCNAVELAAA